MGKYSKQESESRPGEFAIMAQDSGSDRKRLVARTPRGDIVDNLVNDLNSVESLKERVAFAEAMICNLKACSSPIGKQFFGKIQALMEKDYEAKFNTSLVAIAKSDNPFLNKYIGPNS